MADYFKTLDPRARLHVVATEGEPSIEGNSSPVSASLYLERTSGTGRFSDFTNNSWSLTVNGSKVTGSGTYDLRGDGSQLLLTKSVTVVHDADGSKRITVTGTFNDPRGNVAAGTVSGAFDLTDIPRNRIAVKVDGDMVTHEVKVKINGSMVVALPYVKVDGAMKLALAE